MSNNSLNAKGIQCKYNVSCVTEIAQCVQDKMPPGMDKQMTIKASYVEKVI